MEALPIIRCMILQALFFNEITIRLDSRYYKGNEFKIKVHDNSPENCYIQKASLNGEMYHKYQLPHTVFEQGGLFGIMAWR